MSLGRSGDAFRSKLEALALSPALPIVWGDDDFSPERDGGEAGWLLFEIEQTGEEQASFGASSNIRRDYGRTIVNLVTPRGTRPGNIEALADAIRDHFRSESVDGVHITSKRIGAGRLSTRESRWSVTPVIMEWWADRIETPYSTDGPTNGFLLEDGSSLILLEDGSSFLLNEAA